VGLFKKLRYKIQTHRHDTASLFQSYAEDVARRMDQRDGTASDERGTTAGKRPNLNHPVVSIARAIADFKERGEDVPEEAPQEEKDRHGGVVGTLWQCAKLAFELLEKKVFGKDDEAQKIEDELKFSTCDPLWLETIVDYEEFFGVSGHKKAIPYVSYQSMDDFVLDTLPPNARVALIGDWGTGTDDAVELLKQVATHQPDVLVHVGDVYYSGTPTEYQSYFLGILDQVFDRAEKPLPVYTLTGNHDMYSGGGGYYGLLPTLNPSPPHRPEDAQPASYFALRSASGAWQLLGMDTGLHDHDPFTVSKDVTYLEDSEEAWHADKIRRFSAAGGRTILFSHHQLFSAFGGIGDYENRPADQQAVNPKLLASLQTFQQAGEVAAWFWGHEHNLCVYEPFQGLAKGRCIGHGAVPVFDDDGNDPYQPLDGVTPLPELVKTPSGAPLRLPKDDAVYAHGFVILQLDDTAKTALASYYAETQSAPIWEETI